MPVICVEELDATGDVNYYTFFESTGDAIRYTIRKNMHTSPPIKFRLRNATQDEIKSNIAYIRNEIVRLETSRNSLIALTDNPSTMDIAHRNKVKQEIRSAYSKLDWYKENLMEDETVTSNEPAKVWLVSNLGDTYHFFDRKKADEHIIKGGGSSSNGQYWTREATRKEILGFIEELEHEIEEVQEGSITSGTDWYKEKVDNLAKYRKAFVYITTNEEMPSFTNEEMPSSEDMNRLRQALQNASDKILDVITLIQDEFKINRVWRVNKDCEFEVELKATISPEELHRLVGFFHGDD